MTQAGPSSLLQRLTPLLGIWVLESPQFPCGRGRTVIEWLEGGSYLVQRASAPDPAPTSTWIIGGDEADDGYTALYADSRGVFRVYRMSFEGGVWRVWRDAPGFSQRFVGILSDDGRTIEGRWERSADGSAWETDFDLLYTREG